MVHLRFALGLLIAFAAPGVTAQPLGGPPGGALRKPQFVAEAVRFRCVDESGYDSPGSDEIYAVFWDGSPVLEAVSPVYEDVDTGETRDFKPADSCITPLHACATGAIAGTLHFQVAFFERDYVWPEFCYGNLPGAHEWLDRGLCSDDDLVGRTTVSFTSEELVTALPHVGDSTERTVTLGSCRGHPPPESGLCACGWPAPCGPEYTLTYRIVRRADQEPVVGPH
jgi:hypothetical protein